jgi:hypothetical protein
MAKRKTKRKKKPKPYDPMASQYRTERQFDRAVRRRAEGQLQPLLDDIGSQRTDQESRHTGRMADIDKWANFGLGASRESYDRVNQALNNLITTNAGLSTASQQALAGALRSGAGREAQEAANLGVSGLVDPEAAIRAGQAMSDLSTLGTLGGLEAIRGESARGIGIAGITGREMAGNEGNRYQAILEGLDKEEGDIRARLPGLIAETRSSMSAEELAKAGQRFQQGLAGKEFGLKERGQKFQERLSRRQQTEQERSNRAGESLQQQTINIDSQRVENERRNMEQQIAAATDETQAAELQARADRFNAGIDILTEWFKPTKQETGKKRLRKSYTQRVTHGYEAMVRKLMASTGMGDIEARRVILAATDSSTDWGARWVNRARQEINDIKRRRRSPNRGTGPGGGVAPGVGDQGGRPT